MADDKDIFIANKVYPNPKELFNIKNSSLEDINDDCIYILDTNSLLVPYSSGKESIEKIREVFERLISEQRLYIPAQVAREFVKIRPNKLTDLYSAIYNKISNLPSVKIDRYPLLEDNEHYKNCMDIEATITDAFKDYRSKLNSLLSSINNWNWDDPVSDMYRSIFNSDMIFRPYRK